MSRYHWLECPMCTGTKFSMHFRDAQPGSRFLFWSRPAKEAEIMLWCLNCGFQWEGHKPGSLIRGTDIMDHQRVAQR
jgi:hypothetical protein